VVEKFQSRFAEKFSIKVRLKKFNQTLIDPETIFNHDRDRGEKNSIRI